MNKQNVIKDNWMMKTVFRINLVKEMGKLDWNRGVKEEIKMRIPEQKIYGLEECTSKDRIIKNEWSLNSQKKNW